MDYINTHGTSTPVGDITELRGVGEAFGAEVPKISSTKSLSGHPLGAASVHEAIYSLIMMKNSFITGLLLTSLTWMMRLKNFQSLLKLKQMLN